MARVYLSLGSNVDRENKICAALDALKQNFEQLVLSSVYESAAVGFEGDAFLNMVAGIDTDLTVGELLACLRTIENENGRDRSGARFSSRTLDIDILTYDDVVGTVDGVDLPRDEILKNAFVLWPLAEIAGEENHPVLEKKYSLLWREFDKSLQELKPVFFDWNGQTISKSAA
ncbi:MAG: 2-amino-4-hydroxy-6-hydroxymethyldihydropteridine diphosphokinase [Pseudomonadales bacterium]|nr:2-amino-4-hydroxy-6-hydroxymethyldihydropteridine diphosphokinase [Pseudomonadales bacterium]